MKLSIEIQMSCGHISSGCKPALRVSDGTIPHQRLSSYQVLDWGPGSTRVLQAILVPVKITHHDTSMENSRVLPEEPIKV